MSRLATNEILPQSTILRRGNPSWAAEKQATSINLRHNRLSSKRRGG